MAWVKAPPPAQRGSGKASTTRTEKPSTSSPSITPIAATGESRAAARRAAHEHRTPKKHKVFDARRACTVDEDLEKRERRDVGRLGGAVDGGVGAEEGGVGGGGGGGHGGGGGFFARAPLCSASAAPLAGGGGDGEEENFYGPNPSAFGPNRCALGHVIWARVNCMGVYGLGPDLVFWLKKTHSSTFLHARRVFFF